MGLKNCDAERLKLPMFAAAARAGRGTALGWSDDVQRGECVGVLDRSSASWKCSGQVKAPRCVLPGP